ncbi:Heterokaryon incompatibility protein 6, OR allele [Colletotrichum tanaceti]|uniref:Heterokaryon incompatibility protein 6, OR allele n=1 Tax=Colletotrichum tanaceti TaxID=1306861 RepID=A0A4U6X833_9PEZI|nr:Heterokaryon incompatibility protein 6, OR allele [Colletotrichum tanaceti]TKW51314.1 Heterokaryon incompatibility protein 6, OR allele [Colletotrichum tanaceti]
MLNMSTHRGPKEAGLYSPLNSNQVRLLRLNPDPDSDEVGSLEIVELRDAPPYYALSHSWTRQHSYRHVLIDGRAVTLGADLAACVHRLSQLARSGSELDPRLRHVWIDSICIDQSNLAERASQVSLMGRLYRSAVRTLIWLGPDSSDCHGAWELLDSIYHVFRQQNRTAAEPNDIPARMYRPSAHEASGLPPWQDFRWSHLKNLLARRWFSRIWVVQEVALSTTRDPVFLLGDRRFPWSRFGWAAAWLRKNGYMRLSQVPEQLRNIDTMATLRRARTPWPLDALVSITQVKFNASDQRDKIFGLLGLARECRDPSAVPPELRPDYETDVTDLYPRVGRYLLKQSRSLAFLTRARCVDGSVTRRHREEGLDIPSWCPDWSDFQNPNEGLATSLSWVHVTGDDDSTPARLGFLKQFSAASGLELEICHEDDPRVLSLEGIRVSTVEVALPFAVNPSRKVDPEHLFTEQMTRILSEALKVLEKDSIPSWTRQFVSVTTAEQHSFVGRDWEQTVSDGAAYIHHLLLDDASLSAACVEQAGDPNALAALRDISSGGAADYYKSLVHNYGFDRAFLVTADGRMGIGPSNIRQGDAVVVLAGGDVPYCVRKEGDHWLLVGESCVQGLMKGEAVEAVHHGLLTKEMMRFR